MDLLQDQVKRLYLRFLLPSLGSAMVMSIYTLTDAIVIGQDVGAGKKKQMNFLRCRLSRWLSWLWHCG